MYSIEIYKYMIKGIQDLLDFCFANDKTSQIEVVGALFLYFFVIGKKQQQQQQHTKQKLNNNKRT